MSYRILAGKPGDHGHQSGFIAGGFFLMNNIFMSGLIDNADDIRNHFFRFGASLAAANRLDRFLHIGTEGTIALSGQGRCFNPFLTGLMMRQFFPFQPYVFFSLLIYR